MADVMNSRTRRRSLSSTQFEEYRKALLSDSYLFARFICKHKDLVPELHRPLSYLACGLTDRLIRVLEDPRFKSYVTNKIREGLWKREIDWRTRDGYARLDAAMDFLNIRWFRGSYKSSDVTHAGTTFMATVNPNITAKITHATDEKAWEFCAQIGETILSGTYRDFFPERIPAGDLTKLIGMKKITIGGRTVSRPQTTIQAGGYLTKDIGGHYDLFLVDDLVMERNATPDLLRGVKTWLSNMEGYRIEAAGVRVRRIHIGTKWDEDDDDAYLTSGANATDCFTIRVPIEEFDDVEVTNILQAGRPTVPQFYSKERIAAKKRRVVNQKIEDFETGLVIDGARAWRCNYLLDAYAGGVRPFPASIVDDPYRHWMGPYPQKDHPRRFNIRRFYRDSEGRPVAVEGKRIFDDKGQLVDDWFRDARTVLLNPWRDLDRVAVVDPAWVDSDSADNWGVSVVGADHEMVSCQLESRDGNNGLDGWVDALCELDEMWQPRVIGFDGGAYQDPMIQNMMKTDKRLRRLRARMVKVPHLNRTKMMRMREGVAEPLKMYRLLLDPRDQATRDELKGIRGIKADRDGIADSLSMAPAVLRRRKEQTESARDAAHRPHAHPALGVPYAA